MHDPERALLGSVVDRTRDPVLIRDIATTKCAAIVTAARARRELDVAGELAENVAMEIV